MPQVKLHQCVEAHNLQEGRGSFKSAPKLCRHLASPHPSTHLSWIILTFWSQESTGLQGSPKAQHYSKHKFPNVGHLAFEGYPPSQTLFASDLATLQIAQTCAQMLFLQMFTKNLKYFEIVCNGLQYFVTVLIIYKPPFCCKDAKSAIASAAATNWAENMLTRPSFSMRRSLNQVLPFAGSSLMD